MQNFMKTIISAVKAWTDGRIQESVADWNENDSSKDSYIKNKPFYEELGKTVVLVDNLTSANFDADNPPQCNFVPGQTYNIIWNGKLYETVCYLHDGFNVIADDSLGCPFYIDDDGGNALYIEGDNSDWTVSISAVQKVVHKLDSKYLDLPTNIATTDDIDEGLNAVAGYVDDTKMNKNDPVGTGSFSMNRKSGTTVGEYSHAEGYNTIASGDYSHAEGYITKATSSSDDAVLATSSTNAGYCTHAEGYGTVAYGAVSHAEGNGTKASGISSHSEGYDTRASGDYSHAEGHFSRATGKNAHAEGGTIDTHGIAAYYPVVASGESSHAEGSRTTASGDFSHAEGGKTIASGHGSHAEGYNTKASSASQHVQGKFNIEDSSETYAHIVGNGTSDTARSNAHTLDWNGVGWFQGGLQVGGTAQDNGAKSVLLEGDAVPVPTTATVGQLLSVKAVDESGKPTEWEAVNVSAGASGLSIYPFDTSVAGKNGYELSGVTLPTGRTLQEGDLLLTTSGYLYTATNIGSTEFDADYYTSIKGATPVKGTDYFTAADKADMVTQVKASLTTENWTFTLEDGSTVTKAVYVG